MTDVRTCARGCTRRDLHLTDCADEECTGCMPRLADVGHLCSRCIDTARDNLRAIPDLTIHAASRADGQLNRPHTPNTDGIHSKSTRHPSPSPAWDTADEVIWWAHCWAEGIADGLRHGGPLRYLNSGVPARNLTETTSYLAAQIEQIAQDRHVATDITKEAARVRHSLEHDSGRDNLVHRLKDRCPSCSLKVLIREDGSNYVECQNCRRIWTEDEYAHLAHVAAS